MKIALKIVIVTHVTASHFVSKPKAHLGDVDVNSFNFSASLCLCLHEVPQHNWSLIIPGWQNRFGCLHTTCSSFNVLFMASLHQCPRIANSDSHICVVTSETKERPLSCIRERRTWDFLTCLGDNCIIFNMYMFLSILPFLLCQWLISRQCC